MATYSRVLLSGSTNGRAIVLAATATPGTTFHTAIAGTTSFDEVYAWVNNVTNASSLLTIEWGGTGVANNVPFQLSIPAQSPPIPILTGQVMQNGLVIAGFSSVASALIITGYVNRIV